MANKKAKVVPQAKIGTKKVLTPRVPIIEETEVNLICGNCNTMLIKGYSSAKLQECVIQCMNCGQFNEP
jgi:hypothetical protein